MVVRRYDKRGIAYYFNKSTGKRTSKRGWKISLAWKRKKKIIPPPPVPPVESQEYNQAANTVLQDHLINLDFKTFISYGAEKKRVFKRQAFKLKRMINDIIDEYMQLVDEKKDDISPHVLFWIKKWVSFTEIELALDYTDFVGVPFLAVPVYQIFKKYFP